MRQTLLSLFALVFLCLAPISVGRSEQSMESVAATPGRLSEIDSMLVVLSSIADTYPPKFKTEAERSEADDLWRKTNRLLLNQLAADSANYGLHLRLGRCYQLGHNLDFKDAFESAETHLGEAIRLRPAEATPRLLLGYLLVFGAHAADGCEELLTVLNLPDSTAYLSAYRGLVHGYYQQREWRRTVEFASKYLEILPTDPTINFLKDRAEEAARGDFDPTLHVQPPPKLKDR